MCAYKAYSHPDFPVAGPCSGSVANATVGEMIEVNLSETVIDAFSVLQQTLRLHHDPFAGNGIVKNSYTRMFLENKRRKYL